MTRAGWVGATLLGLMAALACGGSGNGGRAPVPVTGPDGGSPDAGPVGGDDAGDDADAGTGDAGDDDGGTDAGTDGGTDGGDPTPTAGPWPTEPLLNYTDEFSLGFVQSVG